MRVWQSQVDPATGMQPYRQALAVYLRDVYYPTYNRLDGLTFGVVLAGIRLFKPLLWGKIHAAIHGARHWQHVRGSGARDLFHPRTVCRNQFAAGVSASSRCGCRLSAFSAGVAFILGALLDLQPRIARWHLPAISGIAMLSYSLYLTHKGVYHLDRMVFGKDNLQGLSGFVIYFATCFIVAATLWFLVERNFLTLRDHLMPRSHRAG